MSITLLYILLNASSIVKKYAINFKKKRKKYGFRDLLETSPPLLYFLSFRRNFYIFEGEIYWFKLFSKMMVDSWQYWNDNIFRKELATLEKGDNDEFPKRYFELCWPLSLFSTSCIRSASLCAAVSTFFFVKLFRSTSNLKRIGLSYSLPTCLKLVRTGFYTFLNGDRAQRICQMSK